MSIYDDVLRVIEENKIVQVVVGKVTKVNESEMLIDVSVNNAPDLLDVRLKPVIDGSNVGVNVLPKIDSHVLVGFIDNKKESAFVVKYGEVEKVLISIDQTKAELSKEGIRIERNSVNLKNVLTDFMSAVKGIKTKTQLGLQPIDTVSETLIDKAINQLDKILL